ncbi:MAG: tetratricopeptide repeat protein [Pseudomonadota bacterium]
MVRVADLDIFYLSFDEPQADAFFVDLKRKCPNAQRVHGVKGFDTAHKTAARKARTSHFITVDADNIVDPAFVHLTLDPAWLQPETIVAWPARNAVNGVVYGNGAIKCWPRRYVLDMRTHENAQDADEGRFDFVYNTDLNREGGPFHIDLPAPMSIVHANATPLQAFRSGFRAGSRLTIVNGIPVLRSTAQRPIPPANLHRLLLWLNVGADAPNGLWTIFGARLGAFEIGLGRLDPELMNDLTWFDRYWREEITPQFGDDPEASLEAACARLGGELKAASGLPIVMLDAGQSAAFKSLYRPPSTTNADRFGNMLWRGIGVAANEAKARIQFAAIAATGDANAMQNQGRLLEVGRRTPRDYRHATELTTEAAAKDNPFALYRLARMCRQGFGYGVAKNPAKALALFERAADLGMPAAASEASRMHAAGEADEPDLELALFYASIAAAHDASERAFVAELRLRLGQPSSDTELD